MERKLTGLQGLEDGALKSHLQRTVTKKTKA